MKLLRFALLALLVHTVSAQVTAPPTLQGIVVRAGTNEPVAKAVVELRKPGGDSKPYTLLTTDEGKFAFRNVQAGQYELAVTRSGYVSFVYGTRKTSGPGEPITLPAAPALQPTVLRIVMTPTGSISGRITDRRGEPVANAEVGALKVSYNQGRRSFRSVQIAVTNDLGEYRLFWLPPGQYYVSATAPVGERAFCFGQCDGATSDSLVVARRRLDPPSPPTAPPTERTLAAYFPGTRDADAATPIDIGPGMEFRGADIVAVPGRVHHVRGVVIDSETGQAVTGNVQLMFASLSSSGGTVIPGSGSSFDFAYALPGSYLLTATAGAMTGRVTIEVGDEDLNNVTIAVTSGFNIPGRVSIEGATPGNNLNLANLRVNAPLDPPVVQGASPASPAPDGTFMLTKVVPGDYRVTLTPALQNAYVKSIRLGQSDILNGGFHVERQIQDSLEIVVSMRVAALDGRVVDEKQAPLKEATVVLVPDPAFRKRADLYKSASTDASGKFQLKGLAPGDYKLFAWDDVEPGAWMDPAFMSLYENVGRPIRISEGSTQTVELTTISSGLPAPVPAQNLGR
jgi:hypothetical protein